MLLPNQAQPVVRAQVGSYVHVEAGITPSDCTGVSTSDIGTCYFDDGTTVPRYNCPACCALRASIKWRSPAGVDHLCPH